MPAGKTFHYYFSHTKGEHNVLFHLRSVRAGRRDRPGPAALHQPMLWEIHFINNIFVVKFHDDSGIRFENDSVGTGKWDRAGLDLPQPHDFQ